jgi:ergothioneine biosynthesis protein EgtC
MCRHLAYVGPELVLSDLLTTRPRSLYEQSWAPRFQSHGVVNADGFGVGWYPSDRGETPARYRRSIPIWTDANLPDLLRTVRSDAVLAAVRSATAGTSQDEAAAAPFRSDVWLFSHNGAVPDWRQLPADSGESVESADLLSMETQSDTALLWAMISRRLRFGEPAVKALRTVIARTAAVRPHARLNLLLTDGQTITASRFGDTLWYRSAPGTALVASEPCDDDPDWVEVPEGSLVVATRTGVRIEPLRAVPDHRPAERIPTP